MWDLYNELIAGIPPGIEVEAYNIASKWTTVATKTNTGVAHTTQGKGPARITKGSMQGMELRELAGLAKSWNFAEASLGVAAINAWYNTWEKASAAPGFAMPEELRDDMPSRTEKNAFFAFQNEIKGKNVAVIGHFPYIEKQVAPVCNLSILERAPSRGDYPDSACEFILPQQDYVFITGMTLINKTLPRLLQICTTAKVALVGPTVPLSPLFFNYGADNLSGFVCTEPPILDERVRRGCVMEIFEGGRMVSINR